MIKINCGLNFVLPCSLNVADVLEVVGDEYDDELDDPQPHEDLGVAVGWRLAKVNGQVVNVLRDINSAFKTNKSSFETVFIKASWRV